MVGAWDSSQPGRFRRGGFELTIEARKAQEGGPRVVYLTIQRGVSQAQTALMAGSLGGEATVVPASGDQQLFRDFFASTEAKVLRSVVTTIQQELARSRGEELIANAMFNPLQCALDYIAITAAIWVAMDACAGSFGSACYAALVAVAAPESLIIDACNCCF